MKKKYDSCCSCKKKKKMISCPNLAHAFSRESNHESGLHLSLDVQACLSIGISNKSCLLSDYQLSIKLMIPLVPYSSLSSSLLGSICPPTLDTKYIFLTFFLGLKIHEDSDSRDRDYIFFFL